MDGNTIEDYAYEIGKQWGVGQAKKDNGILLLIAMTERKMRIEVGSGLEGAIPDIVSGQIIRNVLAPAFKRSAYYNGIDLATDNIIEASKHEYVPTADDLSNTDAGGSIIPLLIFFGLFLFIFIAIARRSKSQYYVSRRGYKGWDNNHFPGGGFIGGGFNSGGGFFDGGGGDSGSSFGGFGGGGFSGGGASGDW
jgi:uncharacterized protein